MSDVVAQIQKKRQDGTWGAFSYTGLDFINSVHEKNFTESDIAKQPEWSTTEYYEDGRRVVFRMVAREV